MVYYKLYIDSVFFIQFVMNVYLLLVMGKILGCTATHFRIVLGAFVGAVMVCLVILIPLFNIKIRLMAVAAPVSMCMIYIAFRVHNLKLLMKNCVLMALCSFFFGSIVLWLDKRLALPEWMNYGIWTLALFGFAGYGFLDFLVKKIKKEKTEDLKKIRIPMKGHNVCIMALLDTGNHLAEPLSGAPVCLISESAAKEFEPCFMPEKYHAIPYRSVGKKSGVLDAYELPELIIEDTYREICCKRVIVAICNAGISEDSVYQMILNPRLMEN